MPPETELIRQQMGQTRAALTEKMEALENQVLGAVRDTTGAVTDTVRTVEATVRDTAQDVRATVREATSSLHDALDVSRHVQEHPWAMLGGAVFAGYVGGRLLDGLEQGRLPSPPASRRSTSSFLTALLDSFAPELDALKRLAIGTALGLMRDKIGESVPPQMKENFTGMMDRVTQKLGGEPTPGARLDAEKELDERNGAKMIRSMG